MVSSANVFMQGLTFDLMYMCTSIPFKVYACSQSAEPWAQILDPVYFPSPLRQ